MQSLFLVREVVRGETMREDSEKLSAEAVEEARAVLWKPSRVEPASPTSQHKDVGVEVDASVRPESFKANDLFVKTSGEGGGGGISLRCLPLSQSVSRSVSQSPSCHDLVGQEGQPSSVSCRVQMLTSAL